MTYREIEYLTECIELKRLVKKYNLQLKTVDNQKIYLSSKCYVFEIHGLVVEDFFYFDLYSSDLNFKSSLNVLLSDFDSKKLHIIYQTQLSTRKQVLIPHLQISQEQSNLEFTLKAEVYFFTMLQLMDELLPDVLSCQKEIKKEHWSAIFEIKKNQLRGVLKDWEGQ